MYCIDNMERISLSQDVVLDMIKLYQFKGKEFYYRKVFEADLASMSKQTIEVETYFTAKLFNVNVSEARMRLIIKRGATSVRNKDEQMVKNIKRIFERLHGRIYDFDYNHNSISELARFLYNNIEEMNYDVIQVVEKNALIAERKSKRKVEELISYLALFEKKLKSRDYELTLLITNFFIDFINMKPFKKNNENVAYLLLYILLLKEGFEIVRFKSFFETLSQKLDSFKNGVLQANFNWSEGFSQTLPLQRTIIRMLLGIYMDVDENLRDYEFENKLNKSDNIENTISKMDEIFTKDELRAKHPYVSDSTINRTLKRLRDEEKIRPLGVGRSAKWQKLYKNPKQDLFKQFSLFDDNEN